MSDSVKDICAYQNVDPDQGLSESEWKKRQLLYGKNQLDERKEPIWSQIAPFFWGPIPWMIEIAALLALFLNRWPDVIGICILLLINGALGFYQEFKASGEIEALKKKLALKARVKRSGNWQTIDASNLVPGDLVALKLGNVIPADLTLISGYNLTVDQSTLTGESLPVEKKCGDEAFCGTVVKSGEMVGVVKAIGFTTRFGKTAKLVKNVQSVSHFQKAVLKIGHVLIFSTLLIAAFILITDLFRMPNLKPLHSYLGETAVFLLVIVIAGIPVALPAVLSMTMTIGASRMAKLKAVVSKLIAVEELAGMDILCCDKTGTLTKNTLVVGDLLPLNAIKEHELILYAALASEKEANPIDDAILKYPIDQEKLKNYKKTAFIPFDPVNKRTEVSICSNEGSQFKIAKGAPQVILQLCQPTSDLVQQIQEGIETFAKRGFRTLAVAKQELQGEWIFLGLISLLDPPREETKSMVQRIKEMGVEIKMVTGDHTAIAMEVASELDLGNEILKASALDDGKNPHQIELANGFSEVFPEHKFNIVKKLQQKGHIVGMTGDGINDAPALKGADIGIAVANAQDAARTSADLILTQPGLMVIKQAIDEARRVFGRMKSYVIYRISETYRLLFFLLLSMGILHSHPLTALMILAIALLNDIPIIMIAYDHMPIEKKPVCWEMTQVFTIAIGLAIVGVISTFGLYWIGDRIWNFSDAQKQTLAFMAILCGGNLTIYLTRNEGAFFSSPLPEWKFFFATFFSQIVGTLLAVYGLGIKDFVGIGWHYVGFCWLYLLIWFGICILTKMGLYRLLSLGLFSHQTFLNKVSSNLSTKNH